MIKANEMEVLKSFLIESRELHFIAKTFRVDKEKVKAILSKYDLGSGLKGLLKEIYKDDFPKMELELENISNNQSSILVDIKVLKYFLVYGFSKRGICRLIKELEDASGKKAQVITDKYELNKSHRGILFLHTKNQFERIIGEIIKEGRADCEKLFLNTERFSYKYKGLKLVKDNNCKNDFYNVLNGELRNLIQSVFKDIKSDIKSCQYKGCMVTDLHSSHANEKGQSRPDLFKKSVNEYLKKTGQENEIDLEEVIITFLKKHQNCESNSVGKKRYPPVTFLCSKHHDEYGDLFIKDKSGYQIKNKTMYDLFIDQLNF
ncbi:hypothetical protein [Gottfriedia acidiceleris]|uniref:hypothetical protein n=1 Tax=Gottfriedia acidiceleris TaxID=371036 RepID=UPI003D1D86C0